MGQALTRMTGASQYTAKIGARTDPYGVFQVRILRHISENLVLVENCADAGKTELDRVQMPIETDLLFPLIRGRDIGTWSVSPEVGVLMVQDPVARCRDTPRRPEIAASKGLRVLAPLQARAVAVRFRAVQAVMEASAFYAMFAVGTETSPRYKVAWRRMGNVFHAAFVSSIDAPMLGDKLVIPSDTVTFVPFQGEAEAFFFLGC